MPCSIMLGWINYYQHLCNAPLHPSTVFLKFNILWLTVWNSLPYAIHQDSLLSLKMFRQKLNSASFRNFDILPCCLMMLTLFASVTTYWRRSVVVSALASINVVNRHGARLVLGWVTACGRVNHLGM